MLGRAFLQRRVGRGYEKVRCVPTTSCSHRRAREERYRELTLGGTVLLRRGGLGAGGRHHPRYATTFCDSNLSVREHPFVYKVR